jgi:two-component system cell cycle sensor histidine kinase/response regulator CckA
VVFKSNENLNLIASSPVWPISAHWPVQTVLCAFVLLLADPGVSLGAKESPATDQPGKAPEADFLSREERQWLADHPLIRLAPDAQYPPFSFINARGEHAGISADYVALLEQKLGIRFAIEEGRILKENLPRAKNREVDVITSLTQTTERSRYLLFTKPYIEIPAVLVERKGDSSPLTMQTMRGLRTAVSENYAVQSFLAERDPQIPLVPRPDDVACLRSLANHEVDAAALDLVSAYYIIESEAISNLRLSGETGFQLRLSLACRNDWPLLRQILDKGLAQISPEERRAIIQRWIHLERAPLFDRHMAWKTISAILGLAVVFMTGCLVWTRRLTRRLRQKDAALQSELLQRLRAEEDLIQSRKRLDFALQHSHVGGWELDLVNHTSPNRTLGHDRIFGYETLRPQWTYETFLEHVLPADRDAVSQSFHQATATGADWNFECRIRRADGEIRWIAAASGHQYDAARQTRFLAGIVQDITERKEAEAKLRRSEEKFKAIAANTPDHILMQDRQLRYSLVVNPQLGLTEQDMIGKTDQDFLNPEDAGKLTQIKRQVLETGKSVPAQLALTSKAGKREFFEGTYLPWLDDHGRVTGLIGYFRNVTERKRLEAENVRLEIQHQQLQKAESLHRMAGAVAHNFNNQLQAVMMNLELAEADLPPGSNTGECLTEAMQAARNASALSALMLTYLGQIAGKCVPADLSDLCRQSLSVLQTTKPENVSLAVHLPAPGPTIEADTQQVQQILINLATNAWEALGGGPGEVQLSVKIVLPAEISAIRRRPLEWKPRDHPYACLEVRDTGCGIAPENVEKLFDPFFTTKFPSRGLGLPVVLGIVRAHDGAITVDSEVGRGSTFRVYFPMSAEAVSPPPNPTDPAPECAWSGTLLLVEDDETVRKSVKKTLTRLGFTVLEAGDGGTAVEVFRANQDAIRCVLCDLTMPGMNGWETLAALRKLAPGIPVILASGYDQAQVMAGDHPDSPQAFLHKPYELEDLRATIRRILTRQQSGELQ